MAKMQNEEHLDVRLRLYAEKEREIYNYFAEIKVYLGVIANTEVARFCNKKAYEFLKGEGII